MIVFEGLEGFTVDSDDRQYILRERKVAKTGKDAGQEGWIPISYHATLPQALLALSRLLHRRKVSAHRMTLDKAVQALQEIEHRIRQDGGDAHA